MVIMILIRSSLINFGTINQNTACKQKENAVKSELTSFKQEETQHAIGYMFILLAFSSIFY